MQVGSVQLAITKKGVVHDSTPDWSVLHSVGSRSAHATDWVGLVVRIMRDASGNYVPSLGFDDVLIVPQKTKLEKRVQADLSAFLTKDTHLYHPIISANMPSVTEHNMAHAMWKSGGIGFLHRFCSIDEQVEMFVRAGGKKTGAGVSLGIHEGLDRYYDLKDVGATIFLVDVAHAHSVTVMEFVERLVATKREEDRVIVGNVATPVATLEFCDLGVDAIKVGVGAGAACRTREVSGAGRGQFTAIAECEHVSSVPIIADGGIRNSGDVVKALAAGASTVMLGKLLAGCNESPQPGRYWGNASHKMNGHRAPEGVEGDVPLTGSLEDTLKPLLWGLRSGISYAGATSVKELPSRAVFERVAPGVTQESSTRLEGENGT